MRYVVLVLACISLCSRVFGQDNRLSTLATVGVATPILDGGLGVHLGANPSLRLTPRLAVEGQVSYIYNRINSTFLSGNTGEGHTVNTLAGARLYLNGEGSKSRLFVNLLAGLNYTSEQVDNRQRETYFDLGLSTGLFVLRDRLALGLSFDSHQYLVLKIGYRL